MDVLGIGNTGHGGFIRDLFRLQMKIDRKVNKIKTKTPEAVPTYKKFAVESIILSSCSLAFSVIIPFVSVWLFTLAFKFWGIWTWIVGIANIFFFVAALSLLSLPLYLSIDALIYAGGQLKLNTLPIGIKASRMAKWSIPISIILTLALSATFLFVYFL